MLVALLNNAHTDRLSAQIGHCVALKIFLLVSIYKCTMYHDITPHFDTGCKRLNAVVKAREKDRSFTAKTSVYLGR